MVIDHWSWEYIQFPKCNKHHFAIWFKLTQKKNSFLYWIYWFTKPVNVSCVQLNKTSRAHCIMYSSPQAKTLCISIFFPFAHLHLPPTTLFLWVLSPCCLSICLWLHLLHLPSSSSLTSLPPDSYVSVSMLLFLFILSWRIVMVTGMCIYQFKSIYLTDIYLYV